MVQVHKKFANCQIKHQLEIKCSKSTMKLTFEDQISTTVSYKNSLNNGSNSKKSSIRMQDHCCYKDSN